MTVRALVVGSLVMDLAFQVPHRPGPGEVVVATEHGRFRGGKGYDQAVALARLGAEVVFVGSVGADAYGDAFIAALTREGVDCSRVVQTQGVSTGVAVPLVTPDGAVGFVQYPGANRQLSSAHVADLPDSDVLLLQGEVPAPTSHYAARVIGGRGGIVLLDPGPFDEITPQLVAAATVLTPDLAEARALVERADEPAGGGTGGTDAAALDEVALAGALRGGGDLAVVTLGADGAAWASAQGEGLVAPPRVDVVDPTGAGDGFCAALALALAEGRGHEDAVRFACAAGAHATTVAGAEPGLPTRAQVEALLGG